MYNFEFVVTEDGSKTLYLPDMKEHYHSTKGAVNEALHVYIKAGLESRSEKLLKVLEIGFGTGLNAFLSAIWAKEHAIDIIYEGIDRVKLPTCILDQLEYTSLYPEERQLYEDIIVAEWGCKQELSKHFTLLKIEADLQEYIPSSNYDLVFFDAFAPNKDAGLWNEVFFQSLYKQMNSGATLTTYCAKGVVRRSLETVGFQVERLPGPKGKREMLRARKLI